MIKLPRLEGCGHVRQIPGYHLECDPVFSPDPTGQIRVHVLHFQPGHQSARNATRQTARGRATTAAQVQHTLAGLCIDACGQQDRIHASAIAVFGLQQAQRTAQKFILRQIGAVGGGLMGSGIATACLLAGLFVVLAEQSAEALQRGKASVVANLEKAVARGKLTTKQQAEILEGAFDTTLNLGALHNADIVIEAIFEDLEVKKDVFRALDLSRSVHYDQA